MQHRELILSSRGALVAGTGGSVVKLQKLPLD